MRHRKANVKLGRTASHRDAMLRNMVTSLFEYERITTTVSKAKALRPLADKMIGLAKNGRGNLTALRQAASVITKRSVLDKVFNEAPDRFNDRQCGYTIMVKTGLRSGDAAPMVILELIKPGRVKAKVGASGSGKAKGAGGNRANRVAQSARGAVAPPQVEATAAVPAEEAPKTENSATDNK